MLCECGRYNHCYQVVLRALSEVHTKTALALLILAAGKQTCGFVSWFVPLSFLEALRVEPTVFLLRHMCPPFVLFLFVGCFRTGLALSIWTRGGPACLPPHPATKSFYCTDKSVGALETPLSEHGLSLRTKRQRDSEERNRGRRAAPPGRAPQKGPARSPRTGTRGSLGVSGALRCGSIYKQSPGGCRDPGRDPGKPGGFCGPR